MHWTPCAGDQDRCLQRVERRAERDTATKASHPAENMGASFLCKLTSFRNHRKLPRSSTDGIRSDAQTFNLVCWSVKLNDLPQTWVPSVSQAMQKMETEASYTVICTVGCIDDN